MKELTNLCPDCGEDLHILYSQYNREPVYSTCLNETCKNYAKYFDLNPYQSMETERGAEAILKFPLPECEDDFKLAINAKALWSFFWDVHNYKRNLQKYEERESIMVEDYIRELERIFDLHDISLNLVE